MELYVIRHGIAEDAADHDGSDDARALTKKGKEKIKCVARHLKDRGVDLDVVISSPLIRSMETAEIIRGQCSGTKKVLITDSLMPDASYNALIDYLNGLDRAGSIAIVGHEPFLSGFVSYCLSRSREPFVRMKKGGVAAIRYDGPLEPGNCELVCLMGPGQML